MAQEYAAGTPLPEAGDDGESTHQDSSSRLETFGLGVSVSILLGAVIGVALTALLDAGGIPLLVALGIGFILAPLSGLALLQGSD